MSVKAQPGPSAALIAAIVAGGLVAGTIDIFAASLIHKAPPTVILQAIAAGLLGKASFAGGTQTMILGFTLQWGMSLVIAAIYGLATLRLPQLATRPLSFGALYGVGVFVVMNFVVVPLSAARPKHLPAPATLAEDFLAMLVFGVIIAATYPIVRSLDPFRIRWTHLIRKGSRLLS